MGGCLNIVFILNLKHFHFYFSDSELNFKVKTLAEIRAAKNMEKNTKKKEEALCTLRGSRSSQAEKPKLKQTRQIYVPPAVRQQSDLKDNRNGTEHNKESLEKVKIPKIVSKNAKVEVLNVQNSVKPESDFIGEIRVKSFAEIMEEKRLRAKRNEETGGKVDNCKNRLSDSKSTYTAPKVPTLAQWTRKRSAMPVKQSDEESDKTNELYPEKKHISSNSLLCTSDSRLKNIISVAQDKLKQTVTDRLPSDKTTDESSNIPSTDSIGNLPKSGNDVKLENSLHIETEEMKSPHTVVTNSLDLLSPTHLNDDSFLKDDDDLKDVTENITEANSIEDDDDVLRQLEEMLASQ
ncbi:uncharacterized protein LOC115226978 isoform X2 [Octopus sinensis]|nr:uncharacterized protein LOC115226978 isoform X2 [Octopus sinensis]